MKLCASIFICQLPQVSVVADAGGGYHHGQTSENPWIRPLESLEYLFQNLESHFPIKRYALTLKDHQYKNIQVKLIA